MSLEFTKEQNEKIQNHFEKFGDQKTCPKVEMKEIVKQGFDLNDKVVDDLLEQADLNKDGKIDCKGTFLVNFRSSLSPL